MVTSSTWANARTTANALEPLQDALPIRLIATPRENLLTCSPSDRIERVIARNTFGYDHVPVVEPASDGRERVVGLLNCRAMLNEACASRPVSDLMDGLTEADLIGANASILSFIRTADRQERRLVVSTDNVSGFVTISDLQQLPVRACLFTQITHLEQVMTEAIRREFGGAMGWMLSMPVGRQERLSGEIAKSKSGDGFVDELLMTQFCDKIDILGKSPTLGKPKKAFSAEGKTIRKLRDDIAHANEFADTRAKALGVCEVVRLIDSWLEHLGQWPRS